MHISWAWPCTSEQPGNLGLALVGGAVLSQSLIQFSVMGGAVFLPVVWPEAAQSWSLQSLWQAMGVMVTSSKRTWASTPCLPGPQLPVPRPCGRALWTHAFSRASQTFTGKSASVSCGGHGSYLLDSHVHVVLSVFSNSLCSPGLWKFCDQIRLNFKFPGDSHSLCQIPTLGSLLWGLGLAQQCEIFGIVDLQFEDSPPGGSMVGLTAPSSKRASAAHHAAQDCCHP